MPPPLGAPENPAAPAWVAAVAYYKQRFGERGGMGLFFDEELIDINRKLSALGSALRPDGVDQELARHLTAAAGVALRDWPAQHRANQAWIGALSPLLERHGHALAEGLAAAYQSPWPKEPIRVDVAPVAGPFGAYTVTGPVHITISSTDPACAGDAALEMIFHEASHALVDPIEKKLAAEAAKRGKKPPRDLWHAVVFYTTGEIVRRRLGPGYVPHATRNGLWARGWTGFEAALKRDFQPYLEGRTTLDAAVAALVAGLPLE